MNIQLLSSEDREIESKRYTLKKEEAVKIFNENIKPKYFNSFIESRNKPSVVMIGGQPASGKTLPLLESRKNFDKRGGVLIINGDDFRNAHPNIKQIKEKHGKDYAFYTDKDSGRWVEMMIKEAQKQKVNVILEGTMRRSEVTLNTAKEFKNHGYDVHVNVIAVKPQESWLGVHERYERMIKENPTDARYTQKHSHDVSVKGLIQTVEDIEKSNIFQTIKISNRKNEIIYQNSRNGDYWEKPSIASKVLSDFHNEPLTEREKKNFSDRWESVIEKMEKRGESDKEIKRIHQYKEGVHTNSISLESSTKNSTIEKSKNMSNTTEKMIMNFVSTIKNIEKESDSKYLVKDKQENKLTITFEDQKIKLENSKGVIKEIQINDAKDMKDSMIEAGKSIKEIKQAINDFQNEKAPTQVRQKESDRGMEM